jgi:type IV pilus biogenesis protein CpaD/CtpE
MRSIVFVLLAASALGACVNDPTAEQARAELARVPERADTMLAVAFRSGTGQLDAGQASELRAMVVAGRHAQRDEFVVVTDGSGGALQEMRAQQIRNALAVAGARWVGTSVEPAMAMGPHQVVVVRSEYRIGMRNCPNNNPYTIGNPSESLMGGYGCADAYNLGQMLARPRDAAVGRNPGPADGMVAAEAVQRYREGRVRTASSSSGGGGAAGAGAGGGAAGGGGASPTTTPPTPPI